MGKLDKTQNCPETERAASGGVNAPPRGALKPKADTARWGGGVMQKTPTVDTGVDEMTPKVRSKAEVKVLLQL